MLGYRQKFFAWTALAFCAASAARGASSSASYVLSASVRGSAGAVSVSTSKRMLSAAGQSGVGTFSSSAYVLKLGFIREAVAVNPTTQYYTLAIQTRHGMAVPAAGIYTNFYGTMLANRVVVPMHAGGTQLVCRGWTMTGNGPLSGSATNMMMTVTNNAVLTWEWGTNFWLDTSADMNGTVSVSDGWVASGVTTQIWGVALQYYAFTNWTGSVSGADIYANPLTLAMSGPMTVTANFAALSTANGTPYWWLARYGLATNETGDEYEDGDGLHAWQEYIAGTDPTNAASSLKILSFDLSDASRTITLQWGSVSGRVYAVEYATNLLPAAFDIRTSDIPSTPSINIWTGTMPSNTFPLFYRITVRKEP